MAILAREIEVTIKEVLSQDQYSFEYLNKTFIAVAKDTSEKYEVNDKVIVSVPQSEEDKVIYILRKVIENGATNPEESGETSSEEEEDLGPRISKYISIRDFKHDKEIILSNKYSNSNYASFTGTPANDAKEIKTLLDQQYNVVRISCKIKTLIPDDYDITYGEYGINFRIPVTKDGKAYYKTFSINSNNAYGNPFKFDEYAEQNITFTWDKSEEFIIPEDNSQQSPESPQFYCYVKDFSNITEEYNICSIKDITISFGYMSSTMPNTYNLYLSCNEGIYFTSSNGSEKNITPILYYNNEKVTDFTNKKVYWYREDYSVTPKDIAYVEEAGIGWRCINNYTTADNKHFYTSEENLKILSSSYIAKTNKIKCIIKDESDKILASNTIIIYNNSTNSTNFYLKIKNINSSIVQSDIGTIRIKAYLEYGRSVEEADKKNRLFKIARYDKDNKYIDNINVNFKENSTINSFIEYESEDIPVNIIQEKNTFRVACTSTSGNGIYNNAEIDIKVANEPLYKLKINGDKKNYKYNFAGKSPTTKADHGDCYIDKGITPLTYTLYDYEGNEIPLENNDNITQTWKVNTDSLVVGNNSNSSSFSYTLKEDYDYDAAAVKPIELTVECKDKGVTIKKKADISFSRETSEGTYGSSVMVGLVPAKDCPSIDYINNYFNNTTPIRFAYYENKLYYYDYVEGRYIPEDEQKIRFYPVVYDRNNFIESKDFSMSSVEIIDTDKTYDKEEDKLKDKNYTNACLKIDDVIDKNYGFTISLKKEPSILGENKLILDSFVDIYKYDDGRWETRTDENGEEIGDEYVIYYIAEKEPVRKRFLWITWDYTERIAYDSRIYAKKKIGENTYIYPRNALKNGWANYLTSNNDQNINIIKIKLNYNGQNYEYNYPIEFYHTEVHPEFLPSVVGLNELYFTKDSNNKFSNYTNLPFNYNDNNQHIFPKNIFSSAYNSKITQEKIFNYVKDIKKKVTIYPKIVDDKYLTSGFSDGKFPEYNDSKRQFEEIHFKLLFPEELLNLAKNKKESFTSLNNDLNEQNKVYQKELLSLQNFANAYKAKEWLNILTNIKTIKISKNNLNVYVRNLFTLTRSINTCFNNDNRFTEICEDVIKDNLNFISKIESLQNKLESDDYNDIKNLKLEEFDFSDIDYKWDEYSSSLISEYETIDLVEITSLIELVYKEIEKYEQARQAFSEVKAIDYNSLYNNIITSLNSMNENIKDIKRYEKIYNQISQNTEVLVSINNIDDLYDFINTLYDLYLRSLFDKQEDDSIILKPEKQFIFENLINKNNKTINYYNDVIKYCSDLIRYYDKVINSKNDNKGWQDIWDSLWGGGDLGYLTFYESKYICLTKPTIYHVREKYEYINKGNS